ncbi:MAG: DUF3892 domain-containing protein [Candidatus Limnocylindrales bacterium]
MASYRIVCTTKVAAHGSQHISAVGTVDGRRWTVAQVRAAMGLHTFYTEEAGSRAGVVMVDCERCRFPTIRSERDHTIANNLDHLGDCG